MNAQRRTWTNSSRRLRGGLWPRLALCAGVVIVLIAVACSDGLMAGIQGGLARVTGAILTVFGEAPFVEGNVVATERFGITVVTACTGLFITGLFLVAVIAFPAGIRAKLIGATLGIGGMFVLNVVRLVSLYFIGVHLPNLLDTFHLLVWQSLLVVLAVLLWLFWVGVWGRSTRREEVSR